MTSIGKIRLSVSFWFLAGLSLFSILDSSFLVSFLLCTVLLHECTHLAAMRLYGARIRAIELHLYGAKIDADLSAITSGQRICVYLCAPLCNLLIGGAAVLADASSMFGILNLCMGMFQLIPLPPLDGGNAAAEVFTGASAARFQRVIAAVLLTGIGIAAALLCFYRKNITLMVSILYLAIQSAKRRETWKNAGNCSKRF